MVRCELDCAKLIGVAGTVDPCSAEILDAFGLEGRVEALAGGEERSVLVNGVVLKKVQDVSLSAWAQGVLALAQPMGCRLPKPVPGRGGSWVVQGWIATEFIEGLVSLRHDLQSVIEVGARFADAVTVASAGRLDPVRARQDRWARADRYVWNEELLDLVSPVDEVAGELRHRMVEVDEQSWVIHGDLSGNVFADTAGSAVVLDFTPYVRPKRYAAAIVVADNLLWNGADHSILGLIDDDVDGLARALLFRMTSEQLADDPRHGAELGDYRRVMAELGWH